MFIIIFSSSIYYICKCCKKDEAKTSISPVVELGDKDAAKLPADDNRLSVDFGNNNNGQVDLTDAEMAKSEAPSHNDSRKNLTLANSAMSFNQ